MLLANADQEAQIIVMICNFYLLQFQKDLIVTIWLSLFSFLLRISYIPISEKHIGGIGYYSHK